MWLDGGFQAAQRKQDRAELKEWRAKRVAWSRASGLRKQLVLAVAEQEERREARQNEKAGARAHRMFLWQLEDDAALAIQDAWRERKKLKQQLGDEANKIKERILEETYNWCVQTVERGRHHVDRFAGI